MKKVEPREANSLKLVPTAQQGRSWSNLLRKRLQALPTYFGRFSSLSSSYITLTTSTNTSSSCPTALNSPSPVCIALPTCFSSSLSVSRSRCQQPPFAPARSRQGCAWTVIVSKLLGSLPSCSPAPSAPPSHPRPCPPPMWPGTTSSPPCRSNEIMKLPI